MQGCVKCTGTVVTCTLTHTHSLTHTQTHIRRNDRNVRNTPYQYLPSRVEQASIETYAVKTRSLPPGGKSMLDTLGATVAFVIRYDLGTVCYIGYNYNTPFHADEWTRVLHCAIDM